VNIYILALKLKSIQERVRNDRKDYDHLHILGTHDTSIVK